MTNNMRRDLYRLTGDDDYTSGVPSHYLAGENVRDIETARAKRMPGADELIESQIASAIQRIHEDTREYPRFPWKALHELSGSMCPEDLIIIAARTGGGKSLFLQNLFDHLIRADRFGFYAGLEQNAENLRIKWACMHHDLPPKLMLAPGDAQGSPEWERGQALVQEHFAWQKSPKIRIRAHFGAERKINALGLRTWTEWAVDHGAEFVIVDHIDRVDHGDGRNPFHEMSETIRLAPRSSRSRIGSR
jgi:hypothetical protein